MTTPHRFDQDPGLPTFRICGECGMWPDHHKHNTDPMRRHYCACADCRGTEAGLPRYEPYDEE